MNERIYEDIEIHTSMNKWCVFSKLPGSVSLLFLFYCWIPKYFELNHTVFFEMGTIPLGLSGHLAASNQSPLSESDNAKCL